MSNYSRIAGSTLALLYATTACHALAAANINPTLDQPNTNTYTLGLEVFRDHYQEPQAGVQVDSHARYGAVSGTYAHNFQKAFVAVDARASEGRDDYKSVSGKLNNVPQQEYELRASTGFRVATSNGLVSPYIGLGVRYYIDEGKGRRTNLGFFAYDRRITQYYLPIGATYEFVSRNGWTIAPNLEYDPLINGRVNSRLSNGGGYNIYNNQLFGSGYGLRGELMFGQQYQRVAWQAGPFFRYWHFNQSDVTIAPNGTAWAEPKNTRLQYGAAVRFQF